MGHLNKENTMQVSNNFWIGVAVSMPFGVWFWYEVFVYLAS